MFCFYYFQGEIGESLNTPNAFQLPSSISSTSLTLNNLLKSFPNSIQNVSNNYHFRYRIEDTSGLNQSLWKDIKDMNENLSLFKGNIYLKILKLEEKGEEIKNFINKRKKLMFKFTSTGAAAAAASATVASSTATNFASPSSTSSSYSTPGSTTTNKPPPKLPRTNITPPSSSSSSSSIPSSSATGTTSTSIPPSAASSSFTTQTDLLDSDDFLSSNNNSPLNNSSSKSSSIQFNDTTDFFSTSSSSSSSTTTTTPPLSTSSTTSTTTINNNVPLPSREELIKNREEKIENQVNEALKNKKLLDKKQEEDEINFNIAREKYEAKLYSWAHNNKDKKNIRNLLTSLHTVLPSTITKWNNLSLGDVLEPTQVKKNYRKLMLIVHPDHCGKYDFETKFICKRVFEAVNEAYDDFLKKEGL